VDEHVARAGLARAVRRLDELGLNQNSSGNLSVRVDGGLLMTPSGRSADETGEDDLVLVDDNGRPAGDRQLVPTSEWRLHTDLAAARPDVGAIVHTHSPEATAAASIGRPLPPIHYVVARFGGAELPCAPYATYGTAELATNVVETIGAHGMASLMANHGAIALGHDLASAVALAIDVEWFCGVVRRARQHGDPIELTAQEIARVAARFSGYGQPAQAVRDLRRR
jgi:L-fuculose-phosphate aldolase